MSVAHSNKSVERSLKSDTALTNKTICFSSEKTERKSERERERNRMINLLISPKKKKKKTLWVQIGWSQLLIELGCCLLFLLISYKKSFQHFSVSQSQLKMQFCCLKTAVMWIQKPLILNLQPSFQRCEAKACGKSKYICEHCRSSRFGETHQKIESIKKKQSG